MSVFGGFFLNPAVNFLNDYKAGFTFRILQEMFCNIIIRPGDYLFREAFAFVQHLIYIIGYLILRSILLK